ncbi:Nucleotide-sugar transporter family protein [Zostera marina]|uniref:Nucleotide-sugar transporter family protein n=1 Tax=Zostera marina TaxID=29655 RepID=A0A0K9PUD2_ZOSMR|nr:Nucleotide-sugar transporter family protein [Zostera marina]
MDQEKKKPLVSDAGAWGMNVVSSVGLIMVNKVLMSTVGYGFRYATTLTGLHFATTAFVGWVSNRTGLSNSKYIPFWELLWFSIVANMSITGMNLSLMLNSVGFYQISKLSITPVVCVLESILHSKRYSSRVIMAVVIVGLGVGICTVTDVQINGKGFLCACVAVLCTSLQQITIGSFQNKYSIESFELLSKTAPVQAFSLLVFGPYVDYYLNGSNILTYQFSYSAVFFILFSCSLAVFCNASQYLCIGRFSAVSFQVLGHMKTVCVLVLGWIFFDSALTLKNLSGMGLTVAGMVTYSWAMELEKQHAKKTVTILPLKENTNNFSEEKLLKTDTSFVEHGQNKI